MKRTNSKSAFVIALATVAIGMGCKKAEGPPLAIVEQPALDANWTTYDKPEHGFSIAAPKTWSLFLKPQTANPFGDTSSGDGQPQNSMEQAIENFDNAQNAEAAKEAEEQAAKDLKDHGTVLTLYDNSVRPMIGEVPTSMVVTKADTLGSLAADVKKYVDGWREQDRKGDKAIKLPIGDAHEVITELTDVKGDVVKRITYIMVHKGHCFRITFRTTNGAGGIDSVARPIADTFRVK